MKMKKLLALFTAGAMTLSLASVSASADITGVADYDSASALEGVGESDWYALEDVYSIVVPTDANLDFTADPQNLADLPVGGIDLSEFLGGIGQETAGLTFPGDSQLLVINNSSVPVAAELSLSITGDADVITTDPGSTLEGIIDDDDSPANNVAIYAVPSSENMKTDQVTYVSSGKGLAIAKTDSTTDLTFKLPAANYKIAKSEADEITVTAETGTGSGQALKLVGFLNPHADWSAYADGAENPKAMGISVEYSFTELTATTVAVTEGKSIATAPFIELADGQTPFAIGEEPEAEVVDTVTTGWTDSDSEINGDKSNLAGGDLQTGFMIAESDQLKTITVKIGITSGSEPTLTEDTDYAIESNELVLKNAFVDAQGTSTRYVKIDIDGSEYTGTLKVTA